MNASDFFASLCRDNPVVLFVRMKQKEGETGRHCWSHLCLWNIGLAKVPKWNAEGWDTFYTVGETDGSGKRAAFNMLYPRALFVDLDNPATAAQGVQWLLTEGLLPPTSIVNTSADKYHVYWFIEQGLDWPTHRHYQRHLADLLNRRFGKGTADPSVVDAPRFLRVPGSTHLKNGTYQGSVLTLEPRIYSLADLAATFPAYEPRPRSSKTTDPVADCVSGWLTEQGYVKHQKENGWLVLHCPMGTGHDDDDGTGWMPPDPDHPNGRFVCHHMKCNGLGTSELLSHIESVVLRKWRAA